MVERRNFQLQALVIAVALLSAAGGAAAQVSPYYGNWAGNYAYDSSLVCTCTGSCVIPGTTTTCHGATTWTGTVDDVGRLRWTNVPGTINCSDGSHQSILGTTSGSPGVVSSTNGVLSQPASSQSVSGFNINCPVSTIQFTLSPATLSGSHTCTITSSTPGTYLGNPNTTDCTSTATDSYTGLRTSVPVFQMTVTSSINATTANATAQVTPPTQLLGTTASVYVFAHARLSALKSMLLLERPPGLLDGPAPDPCVLAQLNSSGQLVGASGSTLTATTTGVLNAQTQTVTILNNVSTPNVAGATFYVGYGATSSSMLSNGVYEGAVSIPGSSACSGTLLAGASATAPGAISGLWWNAAESGWGIHFTQRGTNTFAAWYTYDAAGNPKWYVSTCAGFSGVAGTCTGTLYEVTGPSFFGGSFNPSLVNAASAGNLQVTFTNANAASMTYTVAGQTRSVALTRQPLATGTVAPAVDYTDIWWNSGESGWGMAMAQQYGITFLAWYVYDSSGKPTWQVATCTMSGSSCSGTLFRTTGPAFGPTFNPTAVQATEAGTITVTFTDANNAVLSYTVNGVTATKTVTRQLF